MAFWKLLRCEKVEQNLNDSTLRGPDLLWTLQILKDELGKLRLGWKPKESGWMHKNATFFHCFFPLTAHSRNARAKEHRANMTSKRARTGKTSELKSLLLEQKTHLTNCKIICLLLIIVQIVSTNEFSFG